MAVTRTKAAKRRDFFQPEVDAAKTRRDTSAALRRWVAAELAADPTGQAANDLHNWVKQTNAINERREVIGSDHDGERQPA